MSSREIARRSSALAEQLHDPELSVGHQAVSQWVNGAKTPAPKHRWLLAKLLDVTIANVNAGCDRDVYAQYEEPFINTMTLQVEGRYDVFQYNVSVKEGIDLRKPALFRNWSDMLASWPGSLGRHFSHVRSELFGWVPDDRATPMLMHSRALLPLTIPKMPIYALGSSDSSQQHVWFIYLPGGVLDVGVAHRERRQLVLAKTNGSGLTVTRHPLNRVELVGYFFGRIIFRVTSTSSGDVKRSTEPKSPAA